jgi:hypothetical protein
MSTLCRRVTALAFVVAVPASAQASKEFWPELDIYYRVAEHQRTALELSSQTEHEGTKNEGSVALYQDYLNLPDAYYRIGYRKTFSRDDASYREDRIELQATVAAYKSHLLRLVNRSRAELRWVNNEYSYRIRDRLHLQRTAQSQKGLALAPYVTFEAYYDSRFKTIDRLGDRAGTEAHLGGPVSIDLYVAQQRNTRSTPALVNALGITTRLSY